MYLLNLCLFFLKQPIKCYDDKGICHWTLTGNWSMLLLWWTHYMSILVAINMLIHIVGTNWISIQYLPAAEISLMQNNLVETAHLIIARIEESNALFMTQFRQFIIIMSQLKFSCNILCAHAYTIYYFENSMTDNPQPLLWKLYINCLIFYYMINFWSHHLQKMLVLLIIILVGQLSILVV